jgi:hypothetical protein
VFLPALLLLFVADVRGCVCHPSHPDTMPGRERSLTLVTMGQGLASPVFFIKDSNPSKANRLLAIPHFSLGSYPLPVVSFTNVQITAALPANLKPGIYTLEVTANGAEDYEMTIGATGPAGPAGPAGESHRRGGRSLRRVAPPGSPHCGGERAVLRPLWRDAIRYPDAG